MIAFPHAKINLGLSIISKRTDGFHNVETVFYPLPLRDALEIVPSDNTRFIATGLPIPGQAGENLVIRAHDLMKKKFPAVKELQIYLHKAIPMGAGLGGGSADAAAMIQLIAGLFKLEIPFENLVTSALELGSDCPFFMHDTPCFATGRGEHLEPLSLDLSAYSFLLVHPELRIGTAWAFSKIDPAPAKYDLKLNILQPVSTWSDSIRNDFEKPVFEKYPFIGHIKDELYAAGAVYASLTGSGSTVYGIFPKSEIPELTFENASQTLIY